MHQHLPAAAQEAIHPGGCLGRVDGGRQRQPKTLRGLFPSQDSLVQQDPAGAPGDQPVNGVVRSSQLQQRLAPVLAVISRSPAGCKVSSVYFRISSNISQRGIVIQRGAGARQANTHPRGQPFHHLRNHGRIRLADVAVAQHAGQGRQGIHQVADIAGYGRQGLQAASSRAGLASGRSASSTSSTSPVS